MRDNAAILSPSNGTFDGPVCILAPFDGAPGTHDAFQRCLSSMTPEQVLHLRSLKRRIECIDEIRSELPRFKIEDAPRMVTQ
jgi:hypothetical protein